MKILNKLTGVTVLFRYWICRWGTRPHN